MSVKIIKREYKLRGSEEPSYESLIGNVGDIQQLDLTLETAVEYLVDSSEMIEVSYEENSFKLLNGRNWADFGFLVGNPVKIKYTTVSGDDDNPDVNTTTDTYTISGITANVLRVSEPIINFNNNTSLPVSYGAIKIQDILFYDDRDMQGVDVKFSQIDNNMLSSGSLNSIVDGSESRFTYNDLTNLAEGATAYLTPQGFQSGMAVFEASIKKQNTDENQALASVLPPQEGLHLYYRRMPLSPIIQAAKNLKSYISTPNPYVGYHSVMVNTIVPQSNTTGDFLDNPNSNMCFILSSPESFSQQIRFKVNFKVNAVNISNNVEEVNLRFYIARYTGINRNYASREYLASYTAINEIIGQNIEFESTKNLSISVGDSYMFGVELYTTGTVEGLYEASVNINSGLIQYSKKNEVLANNRRKRYELSFKYMIPGFMESLENLEESIMPSYYIGQNSITDNFSIEFLPNWNNPNQKIALDQRYNVVKGNVGWFNENFNGLINRYNVQNIQYFNENGDTVDALDYAVQTKVKAVINSEVGFQTNSKFSLGFAYIPINEEDYAENNFAYHQNLYINSGDINAMFNANEYYNNTYFGAGKEGRSVAIKNVRISIVNGQAIAEFIVVPNAQFTEFMEQKGADDRNYVIYISVSDASLSDQFSDRVSLLCDYNQMEKRIPSAGEYPYLENEFVEHPYGKYNQQGVAKYDGFIQDDIFTRFRFKIPKDGSINIQTIEIGYQARSTSSQSTFNLERQSIPVNQFPFLNGVLNIDVEYDRGFKDNFIEQENTLYNYNNYRKAILKHEPIFDSQEFSSYYGSFGTILRYEDWIPKNGVNNAFFDAGLPQNGLNNDWFRYATRQGWKVEKYFEFNAFVNGQLVQYKNTYPIKLRDYDSNQFIETAHRYYNSNGDLINIGTDPETSKPLGTILFDDITTIQVDFELSNGEEWGDLDNLYATMTIESEKGEGRTGMYLNSTMYNTNEFNPFGFNELLYFSIDEDNKILTVTGIINRPDLLELSTRYRVTCRLGCYNQDIPPTPEGLYEDLYEDTYE